MHLTMDRTLLFRIIELLTPYVQGQSERVALVQRALYGSSVVAQINYDGPTRMFATNLVTTLNIYGMIDGEPAIAILLRELRDQVGTDTRAEIDAIIAQISPDEKTTEPFKASPTLADDNNSDDSTLQPIVDADESNEKSSNYRVYISYPRNDGRDSALSLEREILKIPRRVWVDKRDIDPALDFTTEIETNVEKSSVVLVCLTRSSRQPDHLYQREIAWARRENKPIIGLLFEVIDVPIPTDEQVNVGPKHWDEGLSRLKNILKTGIASLRPSTSNNSWKVTQDPYAIYLDRAYESIVFGINRRILNPKEITLSSHETEGKVQQHDADDTPVWMRSKAKEMPPTFMMRRHTARLDQFASLESAYKHHNGRLLLLGEPGSGKTITMMAFARDMINDRRDNPDLPLPIYIQIATWDARRQPNLTEWLTHHVSGIADDIPVDRLLHDEKLLLILDGLDELGERRVIETRDPVSNAVIEVTSFDPRAKFLAMIPKLNHVVLSSRIKDFDDIGQKANLNGAATLNPLSKDQMQEFLTALPELWKLIQQDQSLMRLAQSPLLLTIMAIAFGDELEGEEFDKQQWTKHLTEFEARDVIFREFVQRSYLFEQAKTGQDSEFDYEDLIAVFRKVAANDAVREFIEENVLNPEMFEDELSNLYFDRGQQIVPDEIFTQTKTVIDLGLRMKVLIKDFDRLSGKPIMRFIHLLIRDYFAFTESINTIHSEDPQKREYAVQILANLTDERVKDIILGRLKDTDILVQKAAIEAIGEQGYEDAIRFVSPFLRDRRVPVLEKQDDSQFLQLTPEAKRYLESERMADIAANTLRKIGTDEAMKIVEKWEESDDGSVSTRYRDQSNSDINIRLGIVPHNSEVSPDEAEPPFEPEDIIQWPKGKSVATSLVVLNQSDTTLKTYRFTIKHTPPEEGMSGVTYSSGGNLKQSNRSNQLDAFEGENLFPDDRFIIGVRFNTLQNDALPLGVHTFQCKLFGEGLPDPVSRVLRVEILDRES